MNIRPATTDDLIPMSNLLAELFSIEEDFQPDSEKQIKGLTLLLEDREHCAIFVAEVDSTVIGMCTVQLVISTAQGTSSGLIEDMVITHKFRGQNIGSQLLTHTISWCHTKRASRVQLLADKHNQPALDFYKKLGWNSTNMIALKYISPTPLPFDNFVRA